MEISCDQLDGRSGHGNESGDESDESGEVPTVDTTLCPASHKAPHRSPAMTRAAGSKMVIVSTYITVIARELFGREPSRTAATTSMSDNKYYVKLEAVRNGP